MGLFGGSVWSNDLCLCEEAIIHKGVFALYILLSTAFYEANYTHVIELKFP